MPQFLFSAYGASCLQWDTVCSVSLLSPHNSTGGSLQFLLKDCCFVQSFSVLFKTNQTVGFYSFRNKYAAFWDLKTHYAAALQGLYLLLLLEKIILVHDVGLGTQPKSPRPWISGESQVQWGLFLGLKQRAPRWPDMQVLFWIRHSWYVHVHTDISRYKDVAAILTWCILCEQHILVGPRPPLFTTVFCISVEYKQRQCIKIQSQLYQFYTTAQLAPRSLEALATHCLISWQCGEGRG